MGKHLVMIAIILVMLFIPVMAFSMMLGYLKSNSDMVCNYKASLSIIFGSNVEETLKIACAPEGVASDFYGGGGSSCSSTDLIPADKRDQYMIWVKEAAGIYLDGNEPLLISLISTESEWQNIPNKKRSGALGLGQFIKKTAEELREFTGGDDKNTSIQWQIGNLNGGTGDARYDPKRSIYAAAHLFRDRKKSTNYVIPKCGTTDTGIDYYTCVYGWGYNTGLTGSDHGVYAAMDRMKNAYNNLQSSGNCQQRVCRVGESTGPTASGQAIFEEAKKRDKHQYIRDGRESMYVQGIGKMGPGVDCVGLQYVSMRSTGIIGDDGITKRIFENGWSIYPKYGEKIPEENVPVTNYDQLAPGDLLFFVKDKSNPPQLYDKTSINKPLGITSTNKTIGADHAGIYYGKKSDTCHQYINASSPSAGVIIQCLEGTVGSRKVFGHVYATRIGGTASGTSDICTATTTASSGTAVIPIPSKAGVCTLEKGTSLGTYKMDPMLGGGTYNVYKNVADKYNLVKMDNALVPYLGTNLYASSIVYEQLKKAAADPACQKCFKITTAYRTCTQQASSTATIKASPGGSDHNIGYAVDLNASKAGWTCGNSAGKCSVGLVKIMEKYGFKHISTCNKLNGDYYTGGDCVHFSGNAVDED